MASYSAAWFRPQIEGARFSRAVPIVALALATLLAGIRASAQTSTNEKTESIRGTVVNLATHAPIPRALVTSSDQRLAALTDSEGRFEFTVPQTSSSDGPDNIANLSSFFIARKPGFLVENTPRVASAGTEITLTLVPEALIVGKVTLPNSEPPDSIFLEIFRRQVQDGRAHWFPAGGTQSRSDGEFRFADLQAGTYRVLTRELLDRDPLTFDPQGQVYGYPPVYAPNAPDFNSAGTIQVSAGMTSVVNLSVARKPYYSVHIPVANGLADGGLNVTVNVAGHNGPGYSLGYNNREQAIEGTLPDGSYMIEAFRYGTGPGTGTGLLAITVHGAAVRGPSLTLVPNASIRVDVNEQFTSTNNSGSITFNLGQRSVKLKGPRSYLNVILEPADDATQRGGESLRAPTGPGDETLVIENAFPGRYWVRLTTNRGYAASVRSGSIDLQREPLVIAAGSSSAPIEITMRDDTAEISGTVEGITSPPRANPVHTAPDGNFTTRFTAPAYIYCVPLADSSGQYREAWVSPDGTFTTPAMAPGVYRVLAFDRPQSDLEYRNPEAMQAYDTKGPAVRVAGGQKEHVRLQLISSSE